MRERRSASHIYQLVAITLLLFAATAHAEVVTGCDVASSGGDITGKGLSTKLKSGDVTLACSSDIKINDVVTWGANMLTLNAQGSINIYAQMNGLGKASLALAYGQNGSSTGNASNYHIHAPVNLPAGQSFSTTLGNDGAVQTFTVISSLGAAADAANPPATPTLQGMAARINLSSNYALGSNIDASATSGWNTGKGFTPIGFSTSTHNNNPTNPFAGKFDGLGHTINELVINLPDQKMRVALFGITGKKAQIRHVGLIDAKVTGQANVGGMVGVNYGLIDTSYAKSTVDGLTNTANLVGFNRSEGKIQNSYAAGRVSISSAGGTNHGSLVGANWGSVRDCYATGDVSSNGSRVGGLVGFNEKYPNVAVIENSYATGSVSGSSMVGGLVGLNEGGEINTSYSTGKVAGASKTGGLVAVNKKSGVVTDSYWNTQTSGQTSSAGGGVGLTTIGMKKETSFVGFDFSSKWMLVEGKTLPMLSSMYFTTIYNVNQLQLMAANLNANYVLGADVDASVTGDSNSVWGGGGFAPVGTENAPFAGSLNGNGYTISGLTINADASDNVGLFGYTSLTSTISNVGLSRSNVTGQNSVGTLVGNNGGSISDSYSEQANVTGIGNSSSGSGGLVGNNRSGGKISSSQTLGSVAGIDDVGGLVGVNGGQVNASYSFVNVTNNAGQAGGLVGTNNQGGDISASYGIGVVGEVGATGELGGLVGLNDGSISYSNATGRVKCGDSCIGGGLVGENTGSINNSYATGGVEGTGSKVGGLVGDNAESAASISASYATGDVVGKTNIGGLVGNNDGGITNGYWNSDVNPIGIASGTTAGATGLTNAEMLVSSNFSNFTLTTKSGAQGWVVVNTDGSLQTASSTKAAATSPMLATEFSLNIFNAHQLQLMLMRPNESYKMLANVDASGTGNGENVWGMFGFVPVGGSSAPFSGSFDGGHHKISRLFINRWDNNVGLFGYTQGAEFRNVGLFGGKVVGNSNVGGLVGYNNQSSISYCYSDSYVTMTHGLKRTAGNGDNIGVLVGYNNNSSISNSYSAGVAYGHRSVGGLVGYHQGNVIGNSHSSAGANARGRSSGGLVGENDHGEIQNSYSRGPIATRGSRIDASRGGLVGSQNLGRTNNSYWDIATSGRSISNGGIGLSDTRMQQQSSFSGWDFINTWEMKTYPALRNMPSGYTP